MSPLTLFWLRDAPDWGLLMNICLATSRGNNGINLDHQQTCP
jgi:hypothetical protein